MGHEQKISNIVTNNRPTKHASGHKLLRIPHLGEDQMDLMLRSSYSQNQGQWVAKTMGGDDA